MSESSFSNLPDDLHTSLRDSWKTSATPASALLGVSGTPEVSNVPSRIADLPSEVASTTSHELAQYRRELNNAVSAFTKDLDVIAFAARRTQENTDEDLIRESLTTYFEGKFLPLNANTLQAIVDRFASSKRTDIYAPLFTAWANRQRELGNPAPKLEVTWPANREYTHIDFGQGMRNVDLTIKGQVQGRLGAKATNCQFSLDGFKGSLLEGAENSSVIGNTIHGIVLSVAKNSTIACETFQASAGMLINLGGGCTLQAETVRCHSIMAGYDPHKDAGPCTVTIGTLYGKVEPGNNWVVAIGETIDDPPVAIANHSGNDLYTLGRGFAGAEEYASYIQDSLEYNSPKIYHTPLTKSGISKMNTSGERLAAVLRQERRGGYSFTGPLDPVIGPPDSKIIDAFNQAYEPLHEPEDYYRPAELSEQEQIRRAIGCSVLRGTLPPNIIEVRPTESLDKPLLPEDENGSKT